MAKILIGIPSYDQKVYALTMVSIFQGIKLLEEQGHSATFTFQLGNPYLDLARNYIIDTFMEGDYTDLIFVDADVAFDAEGFCKLMKHDVPVIGGAYPYHSTIDNGFPVDIKLDEDQFPVADLQRGIIECEHIPTGFMRIRRSAIEHLNVEYLNNVDEKGKTFHFRTGLVFQHRGDNKYYGEDVFFCKICSDAGISIYLDPDIGFCHFGTHQYTGKFSDYLKEHGTPKGCKK